MIKETCKTSTLELLYSVVVRVGNIDHDLSLVMGVHDELGSAVALFNSLKDAAFRGGQHNECLVTGLLGDGLCDFQAILVGNVVLVFEPLIFKVLFFDIFIQVVNFHIEDFLLFL